MTRLHNDQQVDNKCKHMTLGVSMLNNIFLLNTKTYNYQLKDSNVLLQIPYCKQLHTSRVLMLWNNVMFTTTSGHDIAKPLGI